MPSSRSGSVIRVIFVLIHVTPMYFLKAKFAHDTELKNEHPVCGTVHTSAGEIVKLKVDSSLSTEEFEKVHLRKLKDARFYPVKENECVIKICGYTRTAKAFDNGFFLTRDYADCHTIMHGNESEVSPNIYNDLFNVTSISCGCRKQVSGCDMNCLYKKKLETEWKEDQCAILYEAKNCNECWFAPVALYLGKNYTTDNSHFIHDAFQLGVSTFECTCREDFSASTAATTITPTRTNAHPLLSSTALSTVVLEASTPLDHPDMSCATIKPQTSPAVHLFENAPLDRNEFERVRVGKLKNAIFTVGISGNDSSGNCVLEICGSSRTFNDPYYYGTCKWYTYRGTNGPDDTYKDDFVASSMGCACNEKDVSTCGTVTCFAINNTKLWQGQECAMLYREKQCRTCYFDPVSLRDREKFFSLNHYQFRSMIIRPGCTIEKTTKIGLDWDTPWKDYTEYLLSGVYPVYKGQYFQMDSDNFSCYCGKEVIDMNNTQTETLISETIASTSTEGTQSMKNASCAFIKTLYLPPVYLFQDNIVDREEFESIQNGKLKGATFASGTSWADSQKCVLEVCGFSNSGIEKFKNGSCEWYSGTPTKAPEDIYTEDYEVSSVSCACRWNDTNLCSSDGCVSQNSSKTWNGRECAVMHREKDCHACYFKPISLFYGHDFLSLNSYQVKSIIIRPGCVVKKLAKGYLGVDKPWEVDLIDVVNYTKPLFHKDSENFSCHCSPEVISEMLASESPLNSEDKRHAALSTAQSVIFGVGLVVMAAVGGVLVRRFKDWSEPEYNGPLMNPELELEINSDEDYGGTVSVLPTTDQHDNEVNISLSESTESSSPVQSFAEGNALAPVAGTSESSDHKIEMEPIEKELNPEIIQTKFVQIQNQMDEVKKLMKLFHPSRGHDETLFLRSEQSATMSSIAPQYNGSGNDGFMQLQRKFHEICQPIHVIRRDAFTYNMNSELGFGHFAIVYQGMLRTEPDGLKQKVAVKKVYLKSSAEFLREVNIYQCIGMNECIVKFWGACCHESGLYILTEFCEGGSLQHHLRNKMRPRIQPKKPPPQEETMKLGDGYFVLVGENAQEEMRLEPPKFAKKDLLELLRYCEEIASGMEHLCKNHIVHVDLAIRNILVTGEGKIKICDFGLSRTCLSMEDCAKSLLAGDFPFNSFAPECITENANEPRQVSIFVDIWAYGCTVWEIFTLGTSLYDDVKEQGLQKFLEIHKLLLDGYRHKKPLLAPDSVYEKMMHCWDDVPQKRPNFQQLREFFKNQQKEPLDIRGLKFQIAD